MRHHRHCRSRRPGASALCARSFVRSLRFLVGNKTADEAQQSLMLRCASIAAQERADFDVTRSSTGRPVRLVQNEYAARLREPGQVPAIPVWAGGKLSTLKG